MPNWLLFSYRTLPAVCREDLLSLNKSAWKEFPLYSVENFVLLKCRNSEEKTRRLRIGSSAEFLYSMTCVVICSHRRSHLKSFLQGIFIVRIGGGTFLGWDKTSKLRAINLNLSVVIDLIDKRHSCPKPKWSGNNLKHLCLARHLLVRTWIQIKHRITFVILQSPLWEF